jgi:hypothetical protein
MFLGAGGLGLGGLGGPPPFDQAALLRAAAALAPRVAPDEASKLLVADAERLLGKASTAGFSQSNLQGGAGQGFQGGMFGAGVQQPLRGPVLDGALTSSLKPAEAAAAAQKALDIMYKTTDLKTLSTLSEAVAALADRLPPEDARKAASSAARLLVDRLEKPPRPGGALDGQVPQVPPIGIGGRVGVPGTRHGLSALDGLGIVVPHRAQRAALQQSFPELCIIDPTSGLPVRSAIDTVERFQGGERTVIMVSATESDRAYLLASSTFLLDPRRLTVAVSRAKRKMILVASRSIFSLFSPEEDVFANALLWKNLLLRTCSTLLWEGERAGKRVAVWGGKSENVAEN